MSISIASPPPGQPIYDVRSQVVVNYASDDLAHPLNLTSLSIRVNSVEWVPRFIITPSFAEYAPTVEDGFVAGRLTIEASISDDAGTPASTTQEYEVFPAFVALGPSTGQPGDVLTLMIHGLDPTAANGTATFQSINGPLPRPFLTVDRTTSLATVEVPDGVVSGAVSVTVNQKQARETHVFNLVSLPLCGDAHEMLHASDGSTTVIYRDYLAGSQYPPPWLYSRCPRPSVSTSVVAAALHKPDGSVQILKEDKTTGSWRVTIQGLARNKAGTKVALLTMEGWQPGPYALHIYYEGIKTVAYLEGTWSHLNGEADFDGDENLHVSYYTNNLNLVRFRKDQLAAGGQQTPEVVGTELNPNLVWPAYAGLVVGCDGVAYLGISNGSATPGYNGDHVLRMVDLATGQLVAATSPVEHEGFLYMVGTADTHEQLIYTENPGVYLKRVVSHVEPPPPRLDEPQTVKTWSARGFAALALEANGDVRVCSGGSCPKIYKITPTTFPDGTTTAFPYCACPSGKLRGPNQTCETAPLVVTTDTTRWKPRRADNPIDIRFTGPDDVIPSSGVLEIQAKPPAQAPPMTVTGTIDVVPAGCSAGDHERCYRLTWSGSWTYTDPNDGQVKRLPSGDYSVVVKALAGNSSPPRQLASAPYDKVSLVEVKKVELAECGSAGLPSCQDGGARLASNEASNGTPMPGGGKAAFPDATQQGNNYRRTVLVKADLEPDLGPDAGQVTVHFRSIDVDDPSAGQDANGNPINDPVDNDLVATTDNRNENVQLVLTATGDPNLGGAAVSYFQVSTTQGNNYRLAASTQEPWLADLCGIVSSTTGELVHGPCTTSSNGTPLSTDPWNDERNQVSEMLTVWRTLHLELDRFSVDSALIGVIQQSLDRTGNWTSLASSKLTDNRPQALFDPSHDRAGDWKGADLSVEFHSTDHYPVTSSTETEAVVEIPAGQSDLLANQTPENITARGYTIRDDELERFLGVEHGTGLLRDLLERVYIKVKDHPATPGAAGDEVNPHPTIPWRSVVHLLDLIKSTSTFLPRDTKSSPAFWAVPVVLAFEGKGSPRPLQQPALSPRDEERLDTHDPTPTIITSGLLGYTPVPLGVRNQPTAVSFVETIRDFSETDKSLIRPTVPLAEMQTSNVAHEALHAISLSHTGGIMCATKKNYVADPTRYTLTGNQLATLRAVAEPGVGEQDNPVCGTPGAPPPPDCCPPRPPSP